MAVTGVEKSLCRWLYMTCVWVSYLKTKGREAKEWVKRLPSMLQVRALCEESVFTPVSSCDVGVCGGSVCTPVNSCFIGEPCVGRVCSHLWAHLGMGCLQPLSEHWPFVAMALLAEVSRAVGEYRSLCLCFVRFCLPLLLLLHLWKPNLAMCKWRSAKPFRRFSKGEEWVPVD